MKLRSETTVMRPLCRGRRRSSRRAAYSPPKPPPAMTTSKATAARLLCRPPRRVQGGAHGQRQAAPDAPRGSREGVIRDGGEADLVRAEGEQEMGDAVRGRELVIARRHAEAVDAPAVAGDEQRTALAHEPDPQVALLEREPGAPLEVALLVAEEV